MKVKDLMDLLHSAEGVIDNFYTADPDQFFKSVKRLLEDRHARANLQAQLQVLSARIRRVRDLNIDVS